MIFNSHQFNANQQQQRQRCVNGGINQQNSLYGLNVTTSANDMSQQQFRPNHMFDLATLNQDQQASNNNQSLFHSAYDDSPNSLGAPAGHFNQQSDHMLSSHQTNKMTTSDSTNSKHHQTTDVSLYSPSSSTSLLYHHYDQISVPNEHLSSSNQSNSGNFKRSNTTTTLNPSNLFGSSQHTMPLQQQTATNQQHFMTTNKTTIPQQELYTNGAQYHLHQPMNAFQHHHQPQHPLQPINYGVDTHQLMLDTILRQHHAATNATSVSRATHLGGIHNRPLSSSGASSMSGQSMALTYGRQPRQPGSQLPPLPPINSSKSQNTLASALQSNQTLNHLGLSLNGHLSHSMMDARGPKKMSHTKYPSSSSCVGVSGGSAASKKWKRTQQRVRNFAHEYSNLLGSCMLLIIIAFITLSILKFTSMSGSQVNIPPIKVMETLRSDVDMGRRNGVNSQHLSNFESSTVPPDVLSSKLLIGEFVILSQNYTGSEAQRSVMAENIVKLMDQVFLSTDMRRSYSRMRVTEILPNKPIGVLVRCNIILNESILYAAQQFGIALYDSLARSNEKLANQPSFIIDKNSIRFNTIPDKDLASVPVQLLPPGLTRPGPIVPPSDAQTFNHQRPLHAQQLDDLKPVPSVSPMLIDQDQNAVVWSEWSNWSSCVDKNGVCDSSRLHSRLRKCVSQMTGEKVEASECRQRFNMQDLELEVSDCAATCANSAMGSSVLSDAPHVIPPITAPSVLTGGPSSEPSSFMLPSQLTRSSADRLGPFDTPDGLQQQQQSGIDSYPSVTTSSPALIANGRQQQPQPLASTQPSTTTALSNQDSSLLAPSTPLVHLSGAESGQQQMSCSNCTSSEICLLTINQKVPFCAKIKDRLDESGCGGWCKAHDQVCQPAGQNAFKCAHNSECLASEWRCHDSQCIPASKRCDGHENCFDSSDEAFCP